MASTTRTDPDPGRPVLWQHYVLSASADAVKTALGLKHATCGARLCDAEDGDSLDVLAHLAAAHAACCDRP